MPILGDDCKLLVSATALSATDQSASATAAGSATLVEDAQEVTLNMTKDMIEYRSRGTGAWKRRISDIKDASISFTMLWEPADAAFGILKTAYLTDTEIAAWALDGVASTTGIQGPAGNFEVSSFTRNEPIGGVVTVNVELVPSSYTHWYVKAA